MRGSSSPARRAGAGVTLVTTVSRSRGPRPGCWGEQAASSQPSLALLVAHRCRSGATLLDRTGRMEPASAYPVAQVFLAVKKESGEINTPPPLQTTEKYLGKKKVSKQNRKSRKRTSLHRAGSTLLGYESKQPRTLHFFSCVLHSREEGGVIGTKGPM